MSAQRIREIPYNYTSFSDKEIVIRFLGDSAWEIIESLRQHRKTGISARMLFEVLGDIWVISRNPYLQDDLLKNRKRWQSLKHALNHRVSQIKLRSDNHQQVLLLVDKAQTAVNQFIINIESMTQRRKIVLRKLAKATAKVNVSFDGLSRVSHVTDATDWRVEYPFVVITPDCEKEMFAVVRVCIELGLSIIPRGGGTGYTGGAIPLHADSAIINTEKLLSIGKPEKKTFNALELTTIQVEAGVITRRVAEKAALSDLIFAVDPTSQDASTIGGNIAMNAGGKKAVCWGTTIDNLAAWKMIMPNGQVLQVKRLNADGRKVNELTQVTFELLYFDLEGIQTERKQLSIEGSEFRRIGLGKDVTNKYLCGLPGIQKEGCDGLITSAEFFLHPKTKFIQTVCLEFFGYDLGLAVPAIVEIKNTVDATKAVKLTGLEHLDQRYVKAIKYSSKSTRSELPKMVLLADVASDDAQQLDILVARIVSIGKQRGGEGFIAKSEQARHLFWLDRSRTAAIAAHTNAFKINEDVVIPLDRLSEYNDGIEEMNIVQSIKNKLAIIVAIKQCLQVDINEISENLEHSVENDRIIRDKIKVAIELLDEISHRWQYLLTHMHDSIPEEWSERLAIKNNKQSFFRAIQSHQFRISYRQCIKKPLHDIFSGVDFNLMRNKMDDIHAKTREQRLFVATHMHAGDGNVHTNIPVNSNDYEMLNEAETLVSQIMQLAIRLGGVISGEHGIGLTKMQFLEQSIIDSFSAYKQEIDPNGVFNRGKLLPGSGLQNAYTPSLKLLQQEALILEASELGELNKMIKDCLRCGKCKPVCTTHVPKANLFYSPRDKILATGLIIEAFLYEEQTRRGISTQHFAEMNDIADHCTICHRCLPPCPVNIDFGEVSIKMRQILRHHNKKKFNPIVWISMLFLNVTQPQLIKILRTLLLKWGYRSQRLGYQLFKRFFKEHQKKPSYPLPTTGTTPLSQQIVHFVKRPLPGKIPSKPLRLMLNIENDKVVPIIANPDKTNEQSDSVFYFPGCGSERLFSQIGLATIAMLYKQGAKTVLPPGYICCGYPQSAGGDEKKGKQISIQNRVLFHRVANTLNYMDIKTVIVSCGTCMDQLLTYQFNEIFPGCRLLDIHEYLFEKGVTLKTDNGVEYLYHDPCHTPIKHYKPLYIAEQLMGKKVLLSDRCCGEAGTFAVARPDIATQVRYRKEQEIKEGIVNLTGEQHPKKGKVKILTSCPACQQGLMRYRESTGIKTDYIVVELANQLLGEHWQKEIIKEINEKGIENVLL